MILSDSLKPLLFAVMLFVAGCATVEYAVPELSSEQVSQRMTEVQQSSIEYRLERRRRLYDLSWPLLVSNIELCPKTRKSIGVVFADRDAMADFVGGLKPEQLEVLGVPNETRILHVMNGSPAEQAGLKIGHRIAQINAESIDPEKPGELAEMIARSLKENGHVNLLLEGDETQIVITGTEVCDVGVKLSSSLALNARAYNKVMVANAGLLNDADDAMVQFVMAHELAHVALRHPRKGLRNALVSGAPVILPPLVIAGEALDRGLSIVKMKKYGSLSARAIATTMPYIHEFEQEADYVGLYMFARAGGEIARAEDIFRLFANESPTSTWLRYTHPLTPERIEAVRAGIIEIERKKRAEEPLLPNRRH